MFAHFQVEIKSPAQLAAIHEFWDRIGDYKSAEPDEYGFRSRDLRTINETLCDGFGQTGRNLVEIRRGIDDLGDRLARQNCRGRRCPGRAYDERKIDAVRQVWALANESAEAKQSLNTRMTFAVALRYGKPVLDQAGITTREEFARIRHAISCRESRARIKALEAARTCAPTTRTAAPEDLPNLQMHKSGENGIISSMKHGATTLALMAAMLCGLGVFGAPVSASESTRPEAEVSVAANGNPQKNPQKIMEAMRANPSITRNELAELIGMTPEGVKSAISSLKASGAIRRVGPDKGGHWEVVG